MRMHFLLSSLGYIIYYFFFPLPHGDTGVGFRGGWSALAGWLECIKKARPVMLEKAKTQHPKRAQQPHKEAIKPAGCFGKCPELVAWPAVT